MCTHSLGLPWTQPQACGMNDSLQRDHCPFRLPQPGHLGSRRSLAPASCVLHPHPPAATPVTC